MQTFLTREEAHEHALSCNMDYYASDKTYRQRGTYVLRNGEYDRPDFKIAKYKNGWGFTFHPNFYPNTYLAPKRQRCNLYPDDFTLKEEYDAG